MLMEQLWIYKMLTDTHTHTQHFAVVSPEQLEFLFVITESKTKPQS